MVADRTRRVYHFVKSFKFFMTIVGLCTFVYILHFALLSTPWKMRSTLASRRTNSSTNQSTHNITHKKVVSFSLYANKETTEHVLERYMPGIKLNLRKIREFYPGWSMRIYTNISDQRFFKDVRFEKDVFICDIKNLTYLGDMSGLKNGQVWRFLPMYDPTVHIFVVRDLDSSVNARERAAVKQWDESNKVFHSMRDHPLHHAVVLAGMWGAKNYLFDVNIKKTLDSFSEVMNSARSDQVALEVGLYSPLKSLFMVHDSYLCEDEYFKPSIPFPNQREDPTYFVGAPFLQGGTGNVSVCPEACRPDYGKDWIYC